MKPLCLIPARGGSKRLPGKNIRPFFGHPLLAYSIAAAQNSGLFAKVVVSTDDPDIGRIAEWYGADYLARPAELASDQSDLVEVGLHAIDSMNRQGMPCSELCVLMPVCPLRRSEDVAAHYQLFRSGERSFQISVVSYRCVRPQWALSADPGGKGNWFFGPDYLVRSQELEDAWCPSGAVWWVRVGGLLEQKTYYGNPFHVAPIDANRGIDVDTPADMEFAEIVVRGLWQRNGASPLEPIAKEPYILHAHD
jgi:pseudaminic acid cytidylyltransferase